MTASALCTPGWLGSSSRCRTQSSRPSGLGRCFVGAAPALNNLSLKLNQLGFYQVIKLLESLYVEAKPLWVQRTNYFKEVQGPNESFDDYWSHKMVLKDACQLTDGITAEDLDVLEILRGVHSGELRKELLKVRDPKPNELVKIARNWQHGKEMEKLCQSSARGAKASNYKQDKAEAQQKKAAEVAEEAVSE